MLTTAVASLGPRPERRVSFFSNPCRANGGRCMVTDGVGFGSELRLGLDEVTSFNLAWEHSAEPEPSASPRRRPSHLGVLCSLAHEPPTGET